MSWLWTNIINPIWPNLAASVLWATPAFVWHHKAMRRHIDRRLEEHHEQLAGDS